MKWEAELKLALTAAEAGGAILRDAMTRTKTVLSAEGKDIKLQADRDSEGAIIDALASSGFPVLAEESGEHGETGTDGAMWVIDPLDGTMNFNRGIPICCVSIGLVEKGEPVLGVIYDFNHENWYTGIVGEGAWLNDEPMTVSDVSDKSQAILSTGLPVNRDYSGGALEAFADQAQQFKKIRCFGSAAMSLTFVASGCVDAYTEDDIMLWDVAAGAALVEVAGGYVSLEKSEKLTWARNVNAASNPAIWEAS
ncbi:MAG: inositol monophosphatase family protein [Candidatus Hydrogenedentota bacterium]